MTRPQSLLSLLAAFALFTFPLVATVKEPIWAKAAVGLSPDCNHVPATPQLIRSPDRKLSVEVRCRTRNDHEDPTLYLRVVLADGKPQEMDLDEGAHELLWAPDSRAFFVNGGESAYAGFFVSLYKIENNQVSKIKISASAQRDMVASFPPCKASNRDETLCAKIAKDPEYNMSGLAWADGSSAVIVMAEVPCSSYYGGIMCQVLGYKLDAVTGKILQRMTARELKSRWQHAMAWQLRIPSPPIYGPPLREATKP
jgi:hypothetical protein